jgi:hypothetical protein
MAGYPPEDESRWAERRIPVSPYIHLVVARLTRYDM